MNFIRNTPRAMDCQNCFRAIRNWFRQNTIILIKSTLFIFGLVWSTMMEKTFVRILITPHCSSGGKVCDLPSAVVVNLHQGISSVSAVALTYATGGSLVRFLVVVFSTTASILGVIYYMFVAAGNGDKEQLHWCLAMVVIASVQAALTVTMKEVLDDHFPPMYQDYYEIQRFSKLLWSPVSLVALEPLPRLHFEKLALVLITMIMMLCLFSVFLLRSYSYNPYATTTSYVTATEADDRRRIEATRPVNLLLFWFCLLILSLVSSSASTFLFLEAGTFSAGRSCIYAILSHDNLLRFTGASFRGFGRNNHLRIGIALLYCVVCCTIAMGSGMSVYWLTPQFFILALMVDVAKDGFQSLYESQVPSHLKRYGLAMGELARGLGGVLGLICIFIFRGRDLSFNTHCIFLAVLSASNFIFYLLVAFWDVGGRILLADEEIYQHLE